MSDWPVDEPRLRRVRELMAEEDLDALLVRAPDNLVYLADYWPMKGYDVAIFPREGDPTLLVMEPQYDEARATSWPADVRRFPFYDERDPRPPQMRALDRALEILRERDLTGRVGFEGSMATQASDRMVGEPTVPWKGLYDGIAGTAREAVDAAPLLARARMIKTEQELERIRLANALARRACEHVHEHLRPGMRESEVGALYEGFVHAHGTGFEGRVSLARAMTLVWSGPGIRTFTATSDRPVQEHEPTLMEIWVCADGYWTDLTKNLSPGPLTAEYEKLLETLLGIYEEAVGTLRDGAPFGEVDRLIRVRIAEAGYPGQPTHPVAHGVGARAHEPPFAHQAVDFAMRSNMVLAIEPGIYWPEGGGLRLEDCFLVTDSGSEKLCGFPDDFRTLIGRDAKAAS